jgi:hypothetical protein
MAMLTELAGSTKVSPCVRVSDGHRIWRVLYIRWNGWEDEEEVGMLAVSMGFWAVNEDIEAEACGKNGEQRLVTLNKG